MLTTLEKKTAEQYVEFDEYIDYQLQKTRSNIKLTDVLTAAAGVATLVLGYVLLFTVFDHWVIPGGFGFLSRVMMLAIVVIAALTWIAYRIVIPYLRSVSGLYAAGTIEQACPDLKSTLLNLVDLKRSGRPISPGIQGSLEKRAAVSLSKIDVDEVVDHRTLLRLAYALLAIVVIGCVYTLFSPKQISLFRPLLPAADVAVATRTEIVGIKPGDVEIVARAQVEVLADLRGEVPEQVTLYYSTDDRRYVNERVEMRPVEQGIKQFRALIAGENGRGILQNMTYRVEAGDAASRDYRITVLQPPSASVDQVEYVYPSYMNLPARTQPNGHIDAWEGTKVTWSATANMPVKTALMQFSDDESFATKAEEIRMQITGGTQLRSEWTLGFRSDGTYPHFYRIRCENERGETDPQPTLYTLRILPDLPPEVTLLDPQGDLERPANAIVPLLIQARDPDFLLRFLTLRIERNGEELPSQTIFEGAQQSLRTTYEWRLEELHAAVGDKLTFWIEARDNKLPMGNRKNSPRLELTIVEKIPEEQVREELEREKQRQKEEQEQADSEKGESGEPGSQQENGEREAGEQEKQPSADGTEEKPDQQAESGKADKSDTEGDKPGETGKKEDGSKSGQDESEGSGEQQQGGGEEKDFYDQLRKLLDRDKARGDGADQPDEQNEESRQKENDGTGTEPGDREQRQPGENPERQEPRPQDGSKEGDDSASPDSGQTGEALPEANAKDGGNKGAPSKSDKPANDNQPGEANDPAANSKSESDVPSENEKAQGDRQPAEDSEDARPEEATGDETGQGTPSDDPNPKKAKSNIERNKGTKPNTRPNTDQSDPTSVERGSKPGERKEGSPGANQTDPGAGRDPSQADPAAGAKENSQENPDSRPSPASDVETENKAKRDAEENVGNEELKGEGRKTGQKSEEPQGGGEVGESQEGDEGAKSSNQPGPGDSTNKPGENEQPPPSEKSEGGKPGGQPGAGTDAPKSDADGGKPTPGGAPADGGKSEGGAEGKGDGPSQGPGSESKQDSASPAPGDANASSDQGTGGTGRSGPSGEAEAEGQGGPQSAAAEKANLEYARKAANLVLKRLEGQIERGEVDRKLLDELGWTDEDMRKFAERLRDELSSPQGDNSPESLAQKRQFEETLKSLGLRTSRGLRQGQSGRDRADENIGARRSPVPPEYRELYEAYGRGVSKRTDRQAPKN